MILIDGKVVDFKQFPNKETLLDHNKLDVVYGWNPQRISFKYEDDSDLVKLTILRDYLNSIGEDCEELLIYYMPYSRMDRSEGGSPFTLKTIASMINRLGFKDVIVVEPHSDVTCAVLDNSRPSYINYQLISPVKVAVGFDDNIDYIVFPDAGAQKRYSKMSVKKPLVGFKHRDFTTGKIESLEVVGKIDKFSPRPPKAIIVDDMSSFGGTFVHTAKALREQGIEEVYLLVAHAENSIFHGKFKDDPDNKEELVKTLFAYVDGVFTTDTLLTEHKDSWYTANLNHKLTVYEIEKLV
jgi:ribose-phosphate pyrophosphokinase